MSANARRGGRSQSRARQHLQLTRPLRFSRRHQHWHAGGYILAMRSRFISGGIRISSSAAPIAAMVANRRHASNRE